MSFDREEFDRTKIENAKKQNKDEKLKKLAMDFVVEADRLGYGYQWNWLGLPIIQLPQDIVTTQEIIWETKPDVIVETGIAWGGSIVMYASILELIGNGKVIGVEQVLPQKNIDEIMKYHFSERRISMIEGSSIDKDIVAQVKSMISEGQKVMVLLDSNHTHDHVLEELRLYAPMITKGQFLVVSDTLVEDMPAQDHRKRPWGPGSNPKTALWEYMKECDRFEEDEYFNIKSLQTFTPNGFLRCIKD